MKSKNYILQLSFLIGSYFITIPAFSMQTEYFLSEDIDMTGQFNLQEKAQDKDSVLSPQEEEAILKDRFKKLQETDNRQLDREELKQHCQTALQAQLEEEGMIQDETSEYEE